MKFSLLRPVELYLISEHQKIIIVKDSYNRISCSSRYQTLKIHTLKCYIIVVHFGTWMSWSQMRENEVSGWLGQTLLQWSPGPVWCYPCRPATGLLEKVRGPPGKRLGKNSVIYTSTVDFSVARTNSPSSPSALWYWSWWNLASEARKPRK